MGVRVKLEILPQTVEDCKEADLGPEMFRICCDGPQVSAVIRKRMPRTNYLFWYAIAAISCGTVKTT
jgi:hypothetical protein